MPSNCKYRIVADAIQTNTQSGKNSRNDRKNHREEFS